MAPPQPVDIGAHDGVAHVAGDAVDKVDVRDGAFDDLRGYKNVFTQCQSTWLSLSRTPLQ